MKTIRLLFYGMLCAMLLGACSAEENHEETTSTHTPDPVVTEHATEGVMDSMRDDAGNMIDDAGNIVEDAGQAIDDAADSIGNAVKD